MDFNPFSLLHTCIGGDVWKLVSDVFSFGHIPCDLVDIHIIHIPKIDELQSLSDFRPISLCNVLHKIVFKVLVWHIISYLETLIGPLQSSFIHNWGIADNAFIAQEILHYMHTKKDKSYFLIFKNYFDKVYDSVDWNLLKITLAEFGFLTVRTDLIMSCISSSSLSFNWNKLDNFAPTCGLRQGDPMYPYLFLFCLEKLTLLIQEKIKSK